MKESKVVIVGAGPSGITAAIYLHRSNIPFILIEKYMVGGKISLTSYIENYPGFNKEDGVNLALKLQDQLNFNNIEVTYDTINEIKKDADTFILKGEEETYKAEYVIVASGTEERKLDLVNENKYLGRGISFCAICDGSFYKNKDIAVVGGGNSALEESLYLSTLANKLYLIHRRDEFKGDDLLVKKIKETKNIVLCTPYVISKYLGEDKLNGLEIENINTKEHQILDVQGLFVYIGLKPNNTFIKDEVEMKNGFIITDENMESSIKNLFAIGDIKDKMLRQVVTATSDGAIAAIAIQNRIKK